MEGGREEGEVPSHREEATVLKKLKLSQLG